jgi:hypothetical protein
MERGNNMEQNPVILNGKYVNIESEKAQLLQQIKTKSEFHLLLEQLEKETSVTADDFEVVSAYIYDYQRENQLGTGKRITLQFRNRVQVSYFSAIERNDSIEKFYGRVVTTNDEYFKIFEVHKGKVLPLATQEYKGQLEKEITQDSKHDPDFKPLSTQIKAQAFSTGCLRDEDHNRDYNHCGSGCGDGLAEGGGTPINAIDYCCRSHDRCWSNFGKWDRCCDKNFVDCANRNESVDPATQNQIWLAFAWSGSLC